MKNLICIVISLIAVFAVGFPCAAASPSYAPYYSYELNKNGNSVSAPIGFVQTGVMDDKSLNLDIPLSEPQDLVFTDDGIYILDSGNSRIIETDLDKNLKNIYDLFFDKNGNEIDFTGARGFDINVNGDFVIADFENNRVLIIGKDKVLKKQILRPDAVLQNNNSPFQVTKVKCADNGDIYVTVDSMNLGIFVFTSDGLFDKFVANNPVVKTADVILNYFYRAFLTTEQIRNRIQSTPLKITNFCIDDNGFLYTVSQNRNQTSQSGMVRCMNYNDEDIINSTIVFGDIENDTDNNVVTLFSSVDVTDDGNIVLLDSGRGKVFFYSENGYLISVFGGIGNQIGTFGLPVEVRENNGNIYVLDSQKNSVVEFSPTNYTNLFISALKLLKERKFDESLDMWKEVNLLNSNSEYAYYGMGLVYDMKGDYAKAMDCFKHANDRTAYSNSFKEYRMEWLSDHIFIIITAIILLIVIIVLIKRVFKKLKRVEDGGVYSKMETKWLFPFYTMRHPVDGCEQFRTRNMASTGISAFIVLLWLVVEFVSQYTTGYIFNLGNGFNPLALIAKTVGAFVVFVVSNWCIATFLEGKGNFKEIVSATSYSLLPYIFSKIICIPLSNILVEKEAVFIGLISAIGIIWTAFLVLASLYSIHQYSFSKTLLSILLTIIGMIIIVFVLIIFYSLLQQAYGFLESLYQEITL